MYTVHTCHMKYVFTLQNYLIQGIGELEYQVYGHHDSEDSELLLEMLTLQQIDTFYKVSEQLTEIKDILAALTVISNFCFHCHKMETGCQKCFL